MPVWTHIWLCQARLGAVINYILLEYIWNFTIECIATGQVGTMYIADNFGSRDIDSNAPFALAGEMNADYFTTDSQQNPGIWEVTCIPFREGNASGEAGRARVIFFVVGLAIPTTQYQLARPLDNQRRWQGRHCHNQRSHQYSLGQYQLKLPQVPHRPPKLQ